MRDRGRFIVIEGCDGAGKSLQVERLRTRLALAGRVTMGTREPTDGPIGALIRKALRHEVEIAPRAMAPLYAADRLHHVATVIEPALARGEVVVCDRYELSNLVYRAAEQPVRRCSRCGWEQWESTFIRECPACGLPEIAPGRGGIGWPRADALTYARSLSRGILRPDLTVVLTAPLEVCAARRAARDGPAELFDGDSLQARVHGLYERAAELLHGERVAMVDADAAPEVVEERVWAAVEEVVGGGGGRWLSNVESFGCAGRRRSRT